MKTARVKFNKQIHDVCVTDDNRLQTHDGTIIDPKHVTWLAPEHKTVIGVALNYLDHVAELETDFHKPPYEVPPKTPVLFIKPANTITVHLADVQCPADAEVIQPGPALAVVIGKNACRVSENEAFDYVRGYTLFNDLSLPEQSYFRPPLQTKCFDSSGPLGPFLVDKEDIADPHNLAIRTVVNGKLQQEANTNELIWGIPALIESISGFMTLQAGDVIATGFPAGRVNVRPGDEIRVEIENIGQLVNRVVTEYDYYDRILTTGQVA